jgi:hypothetical protein
MAKKGRSGTGRKRASAKGRSLGKPPVTAENLDRARLSQLLSLNPRLCGSRQDGWDTQAIAGYLRRHGYAGIHGGTLRNALKLSGLQQSSKTKYWQIGPPLPIPPSPRAFEYRLKELRRPPFVQPGLLIPTPKRLRFLQVLDRTGRWMHRTELVPKAAPGMEKNTAIPLLDALVEGGYVEARRENGVAHVHRSRSQWRILPHGERTVVLMRAFAGQLHRRKSPTAADAEILNLLRAWPNGLYGPQIVRALGRLHSRTKAFHLLHRALRNGHVEVTTVADTVKFKLWGQRRRFYRMTREGNRWAEILEKLAASRFPERNAPETAARPKALVVDDGDIPVPDPFTEEMTPQELASAEELSRAKQMKADPGLFEDLGDGRLAYRGPALSEQAALAMGFGLAVQRLRVTAGISRDQFAKLTGLRLTYLVLLEAGKCLPAPAKWIKFAKILCPTTVALIRQVCQIIVDELPTLPDEKPVVKLGILRGDRQRSSGTARSRAVATTRMARASRDAQHRAATKAGRG